MLVPDLHEGADCFLRVPQRNPIYRFHFTRVRAQGFIIANHNAILFAIDGQDVQRLTRGESESLPLSDSELMHSTVPRDHLAIFIDNLAARVAQRSSGFPR